MQNALNIRVQFNSLARKSLTKTKFKIRWAKGALPINTSYRSPKARQVIKMRFWVELNDHVPDGQTVTSLLRFDTKQTYSESMSGGKGVAAVTQPLLS